MKLIETYRDISVYQTTNNSHGNPRYVVWYPGFDNLEPKDPGMDFYTRMILQEQNVKMALRGRLYRGKDFGGGIVFTSYDYRADIDRALETVI